MKGHVEVVQQLLAINADTNQADEVPIASHKRHTLHLFELLLAAAVPAAAPCYRSFGWMITREKSRPVVDCW